MQIKITQMFVVLLQMALLLGGTGAVQAQAVTPTQAFTALNVKSSLKSEGSNLPSVLILKYIDTMNANLGLAPLKDGPYAGLIFTLDGKETRIQSPAIDAAQTYEQLLVAIQNALAANSATAGIVQASLGAPFSVFDPYSGNRVAGTEIQLISNNAVMSPIGLYSSGTLPPGGNFYVSFEALPSLKVTPMVAAGTGHTAMLDRSGRVYALGNNASGQLGNGSTTNSSTPVQAVNLSQVRAVAAQGSRTHALKLDGTVWSWGENSRGQLGDGTTSSRVAPTQVAFLTDVIAISAGGGSFGSHTLALKSNGTVWAWGSNEYGQLGDGSRDSRATPGQVKYITDVIAISAGWSHSLALKRDGTVWAWGFNFKGQLGTPSLNFIDYPWQVSNLANVVSIAAGQAYSLALKDDGTVWAWGYNAYGQLGDGTKIDHSAPTRMANIENVVAIAAGYAQSVALKRDGTVWKSGSYFYGQDFDSAFKEKLWLILSAIADNIVMDSPNGSLYAVPVPNLTNVIAVSTGGGLVFGTTLSLKADGTVWAMGGNDSAQLGDGTFVDHWTPVLMINSTANGPLDLIPEVPNDIPTDKIPPYWLQVTKAADVATAITYNNEDLNKEGSVYVVAYLDPASPLLAGSTALPRAVKAAAGTSTPVPAVLTRSGWKQMNSATPTEPLYSGPLIPSKNTFSMYEASKFDNTKDNGLFCVAYAGASANSAKGLIRSVVSGKDANLNQCPPLLVGIATTMSECFFNWAERSFPQYFAPAAAASTTATPYFYRYYSGTGNYLATNSSDRHVWALGQATNGNLLDLGPLTNFTGTAGCQ